MSVYFHQLNFVNLQCDLFVSITHRQVLLQVQYIQGNALTRSAQWLKSKPAGSRTWTVFSFQTSIRNKTHFCIVVINIIVVVVVTILSRYYTTNTNYKPAVNAPSSPQASSSSSFPFYSRQHLQVQHRHLLSWSARRTPDIKPNEMNGGRKNSIPLISPIL